MKCKQCNIESPLIERVIFGYCPQCFVYYGISCIQPKTIVHKETFRNNEDKKEMHIAFLYECIRFKRRNPEKYKLIQEYKRRFIEDCFQNIGELLKDENRNKETPRDRI